MNERLMLFAALVVLAPLVTVACLHTCHPRGDVRPAVLW
jgi:hypothetical protein